MSLLELTAGAAAYLLSLLSLGLVAWAVAEIALPRPARPGLRAAAAIAGQWVLCALLVQTLGLLGMLRVPWFLAGSLAPGIAVLLRRRERRPLEGFCRLWQRLFRVWVVAPGGGAGWLGALFVLYLAKRYYFLPQDIDALTLHAPMVVEWVQSGRVALGSFWNYPQCWEYQFAPSFLLLRSDVLVVIPGLQAALAMLLALRELGGRLGLGGKLGQLLALLAVALPIFWRDAMKGDPVFAFALLLGILAVDRIGRRRRGGFWLLQLAIFLVLGTKPTGFLYAGALGLAALALAWPRRERAKQAGVQKLVLLVAATLLLQGSAAAVQLSNAAAHGGNPVFPLRFALLGHEIFPGPGDLTGTSILENIRDLEVWRHLLLVGSLVIGAEWPLILLLLGVATAASLLALRRRPEPGQALALALPWVALLLWVLFLATPWSSGLTRGAFQFLRTGASLRYALAPLASTYLLAAAVAQKWLGRRTLFAGLAIAVPVLLFVKWQRVGLVGDNRFFVWKLAAVWLLAAAIAAALRRWPLAAKLAPGMKLVAAFLAMLALATAFARWAESIREEFWMPGYKEIWTHFYDRLPPGTRVATNDPMASYRYFLYGRRFANEIRIVGIGKTGEEGVIPEDLDTFYLFAARGEGQKQKLLAAMGRRGWKVLANPDDRQTALLVRQ